MNGPFHFDARCTITEAPIVRQRDLPYGPPEEFQPAVDAWIAEEYETTVEPGSGYFETECGCYSTWTMQDALIVHWTDAGGDSHSEDRWDDFGSVLTGVIKKAREIKEASA